MKKLRSFFSDKETRKIWFKKIGIAGFLFFLLKGIAWLLIGYFIVR